MRCSLTTRTTASERCAAIQRTKTVTSVARANADLCLASSSPRRRELLEQIGVRFVVDVADIDEALRPGEAPSQYVARLATEKAQAVFARRHGDLPVLGADTTVVIGAAVLGKPQDRDSALAMLAQLSGREHDVLTSIALVTSTSVGVRTSVSRVLFRAITPAEASAYWATGEPLGKAGGYAVQGLGAVFIERLAGSYSGVMGLPLFETAQLLEAATVPYWTKHKIEANK
jgi:septum formation protein